LSVIEEQIHTAVEQIARAKNRINLWEMNMTTNVSQAESGVVEKDFFHRSPFCSFAFKVAVDIKAAALSVKRVKKALVYRGDHTIDEEINKQ